MKKSKFGNLNFDSVETLSREELKKVKGGYSGTGDGTPWGFNVRYTLSCNCTTFFNQDKDWTAPDIEYSGCSSLSSARSACSNALGAPSNCVTLNVTTC